MRRRTPSKSMCPGCGHVLAVAERHGQEIDFCAHCGGAWLDATELATLASRAASALGAAAARPAGRVSERACPRCRRRLRIEGLDLDAGSFIEIDVCGAACGVFLDAGELAQLTAAEAPWKQEFFAAVGSRQGGSP